MPNPPSPSRPPQLDPLQIQPGGSPQVSRLRSYRPDAPPPPPQLPPGNETDRFADWYAPTQPFLVPSSQTMPRRWELAFPTQLADWRQRSSRLSQVPEQSHGMILGQTWMFPVTIPEGESLHLDNSRQERQMIQPARQRLVLVCMPPQVILHQGDQVAVSDPRDRERPINASRMPQEVLTVEGAPRLLLQHELESLAWGASQDREALVGDILPPDSAPTPSTT